MPNAARAFSLHEQYAKIRGTPLDNSKPWLVIDNIPNGAMNEKFLFPEKHKIPGMKVHDLMDMLQNFLNYKLPLLVRSAPVPETNAEVIPSDAQNKRRMRGVLSNSHVIDVVSDTFREIVLGKFWIPCLFFTMVPVQKLTPTCIVFFFYIYTHICTRIIINLVLKMKHEHVFC